jgi:hypothetical protein
MVGVRGVIPVSPNSRSRLHPQRNWRREFHCRSVICDIYRPGVFLCPSRRFWSFAEISVPRSARLSSVTSSVTLVSPEGSSVCQTSCQVGAKYLGNERSLREFRFHSLSPTISDANCERHWRKSAPRTSSLAYLVSELERLARRDIPPPARAIPTNAALFERIDS